MFVGEVALQNFRNFKEMTISLSSGVNLFYGDNGSGKTSLLEALHLYWNGKSFRTKSLNDIVSRGSDYFIVSGKVNKEDGTDSFGVDYNKSNRQRRVKLEGEHVKKSSMLASFFPTLYFSPTTSYYSSASPKERRDVLFWYLFHVEHEFAPAYSEYRKALSQRNALLRNAKKFIIKNSESTRVDLPEHMVSQLDFWERKIVCFNTDLERILVKSLETLNKELRLLQQNHLEGFKVSSFSVKKLNASTISNEQELKEKRHTDVILGYTSVGFHRADISFISEGKKLSSLSRGEEKTVSLFFLISILCVVKKTKENILFLVDDISSELDFKNLRILFNTLKELSIQCFISAIDRDSLADHLEILKNYKLFHVKHGWITED